MIAKIKEWLKKIWGNDLIKAIIILSGVIIVLVFAIFIMSQCG